MSKAVVNEAVQEWVSRFGSNDEDRLIEQATIGKTMGLLYSSLRADIWIKKRLSDFLPV